MISLHPALLWTLEFLRIAGPIIVVVIRTIRDIDRERWENAHPDRDLAERHTRWIDNEELAVEWVRRRAMKRAREGLDESDGAEAGG